ncbi:MAG: SGNH/GDSL hydrolase family protein [Candidatus Dormibacteria bacterium]
MTAGDETLTPPRRGLLSRLPFANHLFPGAAITRAQVDPYAARWAAANERDQELQGPLWVVLGDSTGQGIGASRHDRGYVGQFRDMLNRDTDTAWRVLNLSRSGDRAEDVVHNQLPQLARLKETPQLVTCIVGANDLLRTPLRRLQELFHSIATALPEGAVVGTIPQGIRAGRAQEVNRLIATYAAENRLVVADIWSASGPPWFGKFAEDHFHPNDAGYALWAQAIARAVELPREADWSGPR